MKSMCAKSTVGLLVLGLFLAATPAPGAQLQDLQAIGSGTVVTNCFGTLYPGCTVDSTGVATGTPILNSSFEVRFDLGSPASSNGWPSGTPQGVCLPASFLGRLTATTGDTITFNNVGIVCEETVPGSPYHFNATYRITGGTGQFAGAAGGGSLTATFTRQGAAAFLKLDGTISY